MANPLVKKMGNKRRRCVYCYSTEWITIDHKKPKIKGGTDQRNNLQYACRRCNGLKSDMRHNSFKKLIREAGKIAKEREERKDVNW